jgi:hypothetical protein
VGVFQHKDHHRYIGTISSQKKGMGEWERDETLYQDKQDGSFFIVDQEETMSGPNFSASHSIQPITSEQAMKLINASEEMKKRFESIT